MRLEKVAKGQRLAAKAKLLVFGVVAGGAPDILRVLMYRPEIFGAPFNVWVDRVLRGESGFRVGDREVLAAFVSQLNSCAFCLGSHRAVAIRALGEEYVDAALTDYKSAPLTDKMKGAMALVQSLVGSTAEFGKSEAAAARAAGLSNDDIKEVVHICAIFCTINSVADSLEFKIPSASAFARTAGLLLKHGYSV